MFEIFIYSGREWFAGVYDEFVIYLLEYRRAAC